MLHAIVVVVIVRSRPEFHFLDRDRHLLLLCFVCLLLRFVLVLSEIDDATNRRIGVRSNLDEVQPLFPGGAHGIAYVHHTQLFSFLTNHAHLRHANSLVDTNRRDAPVIRTLTATSKACSYSAPPKIETIHRLHRFNYLCNLWIAVVCQRARFDQPLRHLFELSNGHHTDVALCTFSYRNRSLLHLAIAEHEHERYFL